MILFRYIIRIISDILFVYVIISFGKFLYLKFGKK